MALVVNKKVSLNYEILEKIEAGIELYGFEVKSLRKGDASLDGARILVRGNEAFLTGMTIPPFQVKNAPKDYLKDRTRKILITKKEIEKLAESEKQKSLTIVPTMVYNKGKFIKIDIAVVRGKKKYDKREDIKKRDTEREIQRQLTRPND